MKKIYLTIISLLLISPLFSQHCEPIINNYLNKINLIQTVENDSQTLNINFNYYRIGGPLKESFQAYLFIYHEDSETTIDSIINKEKEESIRSLKINENVIKLITPYTYQLLSIKINNISERNYPGNYQFNYTISNEELFKTLVNGFDIDEQAIMDERFKFFVFIPFLESPFSNIEGLPEDKHDCNAFDHQFQIAVSLPYVFYFTRYTWIKKRILKIESD